jgi:hypothetical protein
MGHEEKTRNIRSLMCQRCLSSIISGVPSSNNITAKNPMRITFSLTSNTILPLGLYRGTLFIRAGANVASIPITLDVKPNLAQPMILVVEGTVISIAFWKLITYFNAMYSEVIIKVRDGRREIEMGDR